MPPAMKTVNCPNCDAACSEGDTFCVKCGSRLGSVALLTTEVRSSPAGLDASPKAARPVTAPSSAREPHAEQDVSVRSWARSVRFEHAKSLSIQPAELRALAIALRRARDAHSLPAEKIAAIHRVLQAKGPNNTLYTVGLGSLSFNRMAAGTWQPAEEPKYLWLEPEMMKSIVGLTEPRPARRPPPARPPASAERARPPGPSEKPAASPASPTPPNAQPSRPAPAAEQPARLQQEAASPQPIAASEPQKAAAPSDSPPSLIAFELRQKDLKRLLSRVHYAMAAGTNAQVPNAPVSGVQMEIAPDSVRLAATDGRRLAVVTFAVHTGLAKAKTSNLIVPRNTVLKLLEILADRNEPVKIETHGQAVQFRFPQGTLQSRLLPTPFPDYRDVMPDGRGAVLRAGREDLARALDRARPVNGASPRVQWNVAPGKLRLVSASAQTEIEVDYRGPPLTTAFHAGHLSEALATLDTEEVEIAVSDVNGFALVTMPGRSDFKYVLLPL